MYNHFISIISFFNGSSPLFHHYYTILKLFIFLSSLLHRHLHRLYSTLHSLKVESCHCLPIFRVIPGIQLLVDIAANPNATDLARTQDFRCPASLESSQTCQYNPEDIMVKWSICRFLIGEFFPNKISVGSL